VSSILVGVGGGIAAYKSAAVVSRLVQRGHGVRVALSRGATEFIGARTFEGLTGRQAILRSTQVDADGTSPHIAATGAAEVLVIAPTTADLLGKLAAGTCDDPVTLAALICHCPRLLCPAMNDAMWESPVVQRNVQTLKGIGYRIAGPVVGPLAEGYDAIGRMLEPEEIVAAIEALL
jgi:phosphopantothenoylcysteine decarboxylase/phosphopantothenate--cysteine ligase